ncbi:MAG: pantoate--beta-alanine ligase [Flavobacteriales bacterium]|nr:pantoate--beta-alanine ligase [Flavobacteriales bacterium]
MDTIYTAADVIRWSERHRSDAKTIGFVPTMGALHAGHISLIRKALEECDTVAVSIFVNPTQFNNPADLARYPSTLEKDCAMLSEAGCHMVFIPQVTEIYPVPKKDRYEFGLLTSTLEGHFRPGHFDGVLTVVKILFELVRPHRAYFGEKDFQQLSLIRKMTESEGLPVTIVACPSVREPDGLAMSSRNMRLTPEERRHALLLSRTRKMAAAMKPSHAPHEVVAEVTRQYLADDHVRLEYFSIVDPDSFVPVVQWEAHTPAIALVAAYVGEVRLIDNWRL